MPTGLGESRPGQLRAPPGVELPRKLVEGITCVRPLRVRFPSFILLTLAAAQLLQQPLAAAGDLQAADRALGQAGGAVVPVGPIRGEVVVSQHAKQLVHRPVVGIQFQQPQEHHDRRPAAQRSTVLQEERDLQPLKDLADQFRHRLRPAKDNRNLPRPNVLLTLRVMDSITRSVMSTAHRLPATAA